ncbi:MAG: F0F1 ATP synthase subunit B [Acidimicrobiia bacterium]|nr:F0F1 ATP synthase subunit B [Acidimicrobiia bacterium]
MPLATALIIAAEGAEEASDVNPILPATNELFYAAVTFFLLWALMKWVFLPPLQKVMAERDDKVRGDLDAADHARAEAELARARYDEELSSARAEASRLVEDARGRAEAKRAEILAAAEAEIAELRAAANAEIAEAKAAAITELRQSVASIAVSAAEAVVQHQLDAAAQQRVIEDYVNRSASVN